VDVAQFHWAEGLVQRAAGRLLLKCTSGWPSSDSQNGLSILSTPASEATTLFADRNCVSTWRAQYEKNLDVRDLFYADLRLKELGMRAGFEVLNLAPAFQNYADEHHVYLHGFANTKLGTGHWNEAGHRLAGELIASHLCDLRSGMDMSPFR
jgi:hypothetical protein